MQAWSEVVRAVLVEVAGTLVEQGGLGPMAFVLPDRTAQRWFLLSLAAHPGPQRALSLSRVERTVAESSAGAVLWLVDGWAAGAGGRYPVLTLELETRDAGCWRLSCPLLTDGDGTVGFDIEAMLASRQAAPPAPLVARVLGGS
jgi:hypothetical protein